VSNRKLELDVF